MRLLRPLLPAVLALFAAAAPAQFRFRNMVLPASTTVIDWNGQPALLIAVPGNATVARFDAPHPNYGGAVELKVLAIAAIDTRSCGAGSSWDFHYADIGWPFPNKIPASGLDLRYAWWRNAGYPAPYNQPFADWSFSYCTQAACYPACGNATGPELGAIIAVPVLL